MEKSSAQQPLQLRQQLWGKQEWREGQKKPADYPRQQDGGTALKRAMKRSYSSSSFRGGIQAGSAKFGRKSWERKADGRKW